MFKFNYFLSQSFGGRYCYQNNRPGVPDERPKTSSSPKEQESLKDREAMIRTSKAMLNNTLTMAKKVGLDKDPLYSEVLNGAIKWPNDKDNTIDKAKNLRLMVFDKIKQDTQGKLAALKKTFYYFNKMGKDTEFGKKFDEIKTLKSLEKKKLHNEQVMRNFIDKIGTDLSQNKSLNMEGLQSAILSQVQGKLKDVELSSYSQDILIHGQPKFTVTINGGIATVKPFQSPFNASEENIS